jgi:hypothetical protein
MYQVSSTSSFCYQRSTFDIKKSSKYLVVSIKIRLRLNFFAALRLCEQKKKRDKKQETRRKRQEPRSKKLEPFAVRFLCVSAPLREKKQKLKARK